jgi:uncharacterized protein YndB with AHSA1/START domain
MTALPHRLDRTVVIRAPRETVFRYFTDSARWAAWWGPGSTIDPRPGGRVYVRYPNGVEVSGQVLEIEAPDRITFTYGFVSGTPVPPGGSRVTIRLEAAGKGTRLHLSHEFAEASARDQHVQGWRYQLSVFGNAVANELHAGAASAVDAWFAAWREPDDGAREQLLAGIATPDVRFRDRVSLIDGLADLIPHIGAAQRFMAGIRLERDGEVRQCQGTALADWTAVGPDGQLRVRGTSVFVFDEDGRIEAVTGIVGSDQGQTRV